MMPFAAQRRHGDMMRNGVQQAAPTCFSTPIAQSAPATAAPLSLPLSITLSLSGSPRIAG